MRDAANRYSGELLQFAYRRKSVNYEHKETFHSHLGVELLFIHQGKGTMIVDNVSYEIKPGMLCIFQPYQLHHLRLEYEDDQIFERSLAVFEPTVFEACFETFPALHAFYKYVYLGKLTSPCLYGIEEQHKVIGIFQSMNELRSSLSNDERFEENSLFLIELFRSLKQLWNKLEDHGAAFPSRRKNHQVENILSWIESHYMAPFRLDDLSKALHVSPYHLSHLFKEATGVSITDYIAARRIHHAVRLLTTSAKSISMIAEEVGLTNSSYFCKLFKTNMGVTPHQYRKRWAGN